MLLGVYSYLAVVFSYMLYKIYMYTHMHARTQARTHTHTHIHTQDDLILQYPFTFL